MDLHSIIDEIASQADDFLAGSANRKEARAGVDELINADYPQLNAAERKKVAEDVMVILENEGFFEFGASRSSTGESDDEPDNGV
ncbi:MAG TPA: hypothetical protein VLT83_12525 [Opitutaceae bacterium]|nr:hypothetical protein [Opitutaceae bacterium]